MDPIASMEKLEDALQLYSNLLRSARCVEVSLFASFKLVELNLDSETYLAKQIDSLKRASDGSGIPSPSFLYDDIPLADLKRCAACYSAEIDGLKDSFESGCELDIQRQHVMRSVTHWKFVFGQLSYLDSCKQYEELFIYRQATFGKEHCHVS